MSIEGDAAATRFLPDETVAAPAPKQGPAAVVLDATRALPDETMDAPPPASPSDSVPATPECAPADGGNGGATTVGGYPIEAELGRGGMGVVYRALDPRLRRPVALKVLTGAVGRSSDAFERFEREAQTLATLNHPNIATIYSLEEHDGSPFFTMEWIEGQTLAHEIQGGALDTEALLPVARQVARALEAAHARGIVHRDLKPANVMVTPDRTAKILDFGIAAAFGGAEAVGPSSLAEISGTPAYMSPEQFRGDAVDPATDAWSFGCLLYECFVGEPAFRGETVLAIREAVLGTEPDLTRIPEAVPERLRGIVERTLVKDRAGRLGSLAEIRRTIEELLVGGGLQARLAETIAVPTETESNLPRSLTRFVGRDRSMAEISAHLEDAPLVTLTGAGGCGKSRLALEAARAGLDRHSGGVWLVELAPITSEERILPAITQALDLKETPGEDLASTIVRHLEGRRSLLLVDNCEHLLEGCAQVAEELLTRLPNLRILASSREALGVPGEQVVPVSPLSLPPEETRLSVEEIEKYESVALFLDRARTVKRGFRLRPPDVAPLVKVVRALDGIPLAIELAAARVKVLPLAQISKRLEDRFQLLTGGSRTALPRQQTLRATIEWSYDLLEGEEQRLLRQLSVFQGGFSLESVESVCAGDGVEEWEILDRLSTLVDKSLVEVGAPDDDADEVPRYRLLETVREYSREKFAEDADVEEIHEKHRRFFVAFAESSTDSGKGAMAFHRNLDVERNNLRAALAHAHADPSRSEDALRLVRALGSHWLMRGRWNEGRAAAESSLELDGGRSPGRMRSDVIGWAARFASCQGDSDVAKALVERALEIERELGDRRGLSGAYNDLGVVARQRGDVEEAREHFRNSLEIKRELGERLGTAIALHNLAICDMKLSDLEAADASVREALEIFRSLNDRHKTAVALALSASVAYERGDDGGANKTYGEALEIAREMGDLRAQRNVLSNLALVAERQSDPETARRRYEESLEIRRELGDKRGTFMVHCALARLAGNRNDESSVVEHGEAALEHFSGSQSDADLLATSLIRLALDRGETETAARWVPALERSSGEDWDENRALLAEVRTRAGEAGDQVHVEGNAPDPSETVDLARTLLGTVGGPAA